MHATLSHLQECDRPTVLYYDKACHITKTLSLHSSKYSSYLPGFDGPKLVVDKFHHYGHSHGNDESLRYIKVIFCIK
jgi:hypothetical protein